MKPIAGMLSVVGCVLFYVANLTMADQAMDALTARLPEGANTIIAADAGYLRESPQAGRMKWVARGTSSGATSVLPSIPGVKQMCIGANLDTSTLNPRLELALLDVSPLPPLEPLAKAVGGYTDTIGGAPAAWSPAGACYLALDSHTLVSAQPVNRQMVARWLETVRSPAPSRVSTYLRTAAGLVSNQTPIVLAMDLKDAFALPAVVGWLRVGTNDNVMKAMTDPVATGKLLTTVRGVTVKVNVADMTTAIATIDFGADTAPLAQLARPLVLELMSDHGLTIPDVEKWTFSASGQSITAQGPLSDQGLRELLSVLQAPSPQEGSIASPAGPSSPGAAQVSGGKSSMASASARYFDEVGKVLDGVRPGASLAEQAGWLWRGAQRIDQLSAVNVDPDLIRWGAQVSANLRQASSALDAGQQRVNAAAQSAQAPVGSYTTSLYDTGNEQRNAQYRADLENYRRQNQRAAAQIRSQVTQEASKPLQAALDSRGEIRATMVGRYGAEFK
jgi:hypothetical protein